MGHSHSTSGTQPNVASKVAIIGAGLSGLALSLALSLQGIESTIYESRDSPLNIGGAVMLSPNALKVLEALGVFSRIERRGYKFEYLDFRDTVGNLTERYEFGNQAKYGYTGLRVFRTVLIEELLHATQSHQHCHKIHLAFSAKFARVISDGHEGVTWELADGTRQTSTLLIGADGIHSTVRRYIYPDLETTFIGQAGITAAVPTEQLKLPADYYIPVTITSPVGAFVIAPQEPDGSRVLIGRQRRMPATDRAGWDEIHAHPERQIEFMRSDGDQFPEIVRNATSTIQPDSINIWPFFIVPKLDSWVSDKGNGRVIILGDAAHAIPPTAGQGINQAFEDVYMLALILGRTKDAYEDASKTTVPLESSLKFWQQYRQSRVDKVLDLNKQIDLRRLSAKDLEGPSSYGGGGPERREFDLDWLYRPDFAVVIDQFMSSVSA
ncbi:hypothetical protein DFH07DRAFT_568660 [Mycena maculata]|uniref:FAD-binding domain-containing protein n=1 Tax=Mycena maculata TaxID=230809 RepID=A0AAD7NWB3_9AGAR|nr:hypothetical protein DFH07DRAFT_568660 [Mycena maculata]